MRKPPSPDDRRAPRVRRQYRAAAVGVRRRQRAPVSSNSPFIDDTLAYWQPISDRVLTREDAREIIENLSGFFAVLLEWDAEDRQRAASGATDDHPVEPLRARDNASSV